MPYTAEEKASRRKAYWIENRVQLLAKKKIYRDTHKAEILAKKKLFYQQNKERLKAEVSEWHKKHPDYGKEQWEKKWKMEFHTGKCQVLKITKKQKLINSYYYKHEQH